MEEIGKTYPLLIISGPTAVGKTDIALSLAQRLSREIINLDSVQVFKGLDIGSAKISISERRGIPHYLIDIRTPNQEFNVAQYLLEARACLQDLREKQKSALFVGGTTMYTTALLHGLAELPPRNQELRSELEQLSSEVLYSRLQSVDPRTAERLHINDRMRVIRALETYLITSETQEERFATHQSKQSEFTALVIQLTRDRESLYERINQRVTNMLKQGLIDETQNIISTYGPCEHALSAIGYSHVCRFLSGNLLKENLEASIAMDTRRFAKRQSTYWNNEPRKRGWLSKSVSTSVSIAELSESILEKLGQPLKTTEVWTMDISATLPI